MAAEYVSNNPTSAGAGGGPGGPPGGPPRAPAGGGVAAGGATGGSTGRGWGFSVRRRGPPGTEPFTGRGYTLGGG